MTSAHLAPAGWGSPAAPAATGTSRHPWLPTLRATPPPAPPTPLGSPVRRGVLWPPPRQRWGRRPGARRRGRTGKQHQVNHLTCWCPQAHGGRPPGGPRYGGSASRHEVNHQDVLGREARRAVFHRKRGDAGGTANAAPWLGSRAPRRGKPARPRLCPRPRRSPGSRFLGPFPAGRGSHRCQRRPADPEGQTEAEPGHDRACRKQGGGMTTPTGGRLPQRVGDQGAGSCRHRVPGQIGSEMWRAS